MDAHSLIRRRAWTCRHNPEVWNEDSSQFSRVFRTQERRENPDEDPKASVEASTPHHRLPGASVPPPAVAKARRPRVAVLRALCVLLGTVVPCPASSQQAAADVPVRRLLGSPMEGRCQVTNTFTPQKCLRCGFEWLSIKVCPCRCARCRSPYYRRHVKPGRRWQSERMKSVRGRIISSPAAAEMNTSTRGGQHV